MSTKFWRLGSVAGLVVGLGASGFAQEAAVTDLQRADVTYKIFQFPPDQMPRIDGHADDWQIVPNQYRITMQDHREMVKRGDRRSGM